MLNHPLKHLETAFEAYSKQLQLVINSYEANHAKVRNIRAKRQALEDSRGQCDSPTMD